MAIGPTNVFTDVTFSLANGAAEQFECSLGQIAWTPSPQINTSRTFCGVKQSVGQSSWTVELSGFSDWFQAASLSSFLIANEGVALQASMVWTSTEDPTSSLQVDAEVRGIAVPVGGEVDTTSEFTVTMPVQGTPVFTPTVGV